VVTCRDSTDLGKVRAPHSTTRIHLTYFPTYPPTHPPARPTIHPTFHSLPNFGKTWSADFGCLDRPQTSEHCKLLNTSNMVRPNDAARIAQGRAPDEDPEELEVRRRSAARSVGINQRRINQR
jgi:hypothetical protein